MLKTLWSTKFANHKDTKNTKKTLCLCVSVVKKSCKLIPLLYFIAGQPTTAQIVPDATLPTNSSVTNQDNTIRIEAGTRAGNNLFHSFSEFSVPAGNAAFFNNALDIQNIFSRVTGRSISNIDGILQTNGTANLFLLNPNGIVFGANASLNIGGSFVATTASAIAFGEQGSFSATTPNNPALLTINPNAFLFNQLAPNPIVARASLAVPESQSLLLVGGNVNLDGARLLAPGGRVELGGLAAPGTIGLNMNGNNLSLSFPNNIALRDVSLDNSAIINVLGGGGGSIEINANNVNISGGSNLRAGIARGRGSSDSVAGDINIKAADTVNFSDANSLIGNIVLPSAVGNGGNINITTGSLFVKDGAQILALTVGRGNAGDVTISARDLVDFNGVDSNGLSSGALSTVTIPSAVGKGGNVNITTRVLSVRDGAQLQALTAGQGDAGNININARERVVLDGVGSNGLSSGLFSTVETGAVGNSGDINLTTPSLSVTNGAQLQALTRGRGDAGSIRVLATDSVSFDGTSSNNLASAASTNVAAGAMGNGGNINIVARTLSITNGAQLPSVTFGQGNAGNVLLDIRDSINIAGVSPGGVSSGLFSNTEPTGTGNGGTISVQANSLRVQNGGVIAARSFSAFNGGNITVNVNTLELTGGGEILTTAFSGGNAGSITTNARNNISISGSDPTFAARLAKFGRIIVDPASAASGIFANTDTESTGAGGSISLNATNLTIQNGGNIAADSQGQGNGGDIQLRVTDSLDLNQQASILAGTASGEGGNVTLTAGNLLLMRRASEISTNAGGTGNGGNLTINSGFIVALPAENNDITANAVRGRGGNININTQNIYGLTFREQLTPTSDITASSEFGVSGVVQITTPGIDPAQGLTTLPEGVVNVDALVPQSCSTARVAQASKFVVTGRGGLPPNPTETLSGDTVLADFVSPMRSAHAAQTAPSAQSTESSAQIQHESSSSRIATAQPQLVEATGWVVNDLGEVVLYATLPPSPPHNPWHSASGCDLGKI